MYTPHFVYVIYTLDLYVPFIDGGCLYLQAIVKNATVRTSLVVQCLRFCVPNSGAQVQSLVRELDLTCHS